MFFPDDVKSAYKQELHNDERRSDPHTTVKLDCCGTQVELTRTGDQIVVCPNKKCGKRNVITWSLNPKIGVVDGYRDRNPNR